MDDSSSDSDKAGFLAEFLARYEADLVEGQPHDLAGYQALYPGREELIAREWERIAADESSPLPDRIAHYAIEQELGRGGQGVVYLARDENLDRLVAIKVLPDRGPFSQRQLARFRREAEVAARLDHPGICTVFDTGQSGGLTYIAMRYVKGKTLADSLRDHAGEEDAYLGDRDALFRVVHLIEKAARAVHAAHGRGIVHRDLKPGNLMVSEGGDPVVLDFGLARDEITTDAVPLTLTDEVFGTPVYMSPEQLRGIGSKIDRRTDVYSLGVILYEALTLTQPFDGASRESLFQKILAEEPIPSGRLNRHLPRDLNTVVSMAMAKERDRRYRTAEHLAEDLRRVREYLPIEASPVGRLTRGVRWCQRNRAVAALSFVLFLVLGVALAVTLHLLDKSETARLALQDSLDDIRAGKQSRKERRLRDLTVRGWQRLYSADERKALPLLEEILRIDAGNKQAIAGRTWYESGDPTAMLAVLDRLTAKLDPVDPDLTWLRGFVLSAANRAAEAAREFAKAGDRETSLRLYFRGLQRVGGFARRVPEANRREAIELFRRAIERADEPRFHHHHSVLMTAAGLGDRTVMDAAAANLEFHWPDSPATFDAIAQFYLPMDRARGLAALRWLVANTDEAMPYCGLAQDAIDRKKPDEAMAFFDKGIAIDPSFAPIRWMRGNLYATRGNVAAARADLVASIERAPDKAFFYASLEAFHRRQGSWGNALQDLRSITGQHPTAWRGWQSLGRVCDALRDADGALDAYERAERIHPGESAILKRLKELRSNR